MNVEAWVGIRLPALLALALCVVSTTACEKNPAGPAESTAVYPPGATCPANITVRALGLTIPVAFATPSVLAGTLPVTTTCSVASNSAFPIGTTRVSCTARDAVGRISLCSFDVEVLQPIPLLVGTTFLAFGDSITGGEDGNNLLFVLHPETSYPTVLGALLSLRYTAQTPIVVNRSESGELVDSRASQDRLRAALDEVRPDALILLEGANDLSGCGSVSASSLVAGIVNSFRTEIGIARSRGVKQIYLSTLTPEKQGFRVPSCAIGLVPQTNQALGVMAAQEGVVLVDNYAALVGQQNVLIANDGLHPTIDGHKLMAQTFLNAIIATFEQPLPTLTATGANATAGTATRVKGR